ncbi:MAG: YCF48-related protein [Gemmataceae bacterium]
MRPFLYPVVAALALTTTLPAGEFRPFDDAAIRGVHFVDDREGWAVGDEGVIWHTIDGGKDWERQASGVRASLRSVHFHTPYNGVGWVAGRQELPGGGSTGVVLYTRDGGVEWRRILVHSLPGMHLIRFVDGKTGYLAGDGSEQFPSGVFATTDSGRTWAPVPGPRSPSWRGGDFSAEGGALGGAWNRLATVRRGQVFTVDMDSLGGRMIGGLQLRGDDAVAVGQGGLVLLSKKSRGSSWHYADLKLPRELTEALDLHAVGGVGGHVWAVGRPGSVALHSADSGQTWEAVPTGQPLPLHGVFFRDAKRGWAVGELGTIVATVDGGKNWQVQRRGGQRVAVLTVHARPASATLEALVPLGGRDGYLTASVAVTSPEPGSAELARVGEACRFTEAVRQAGGAIAETLWPFPVATHLAHADRDRLLAAWNRLHGDRAPEALLTQLVTAIRMYRPDVIVTDSPEDDAATALVAEALGEAFRRAADPDSLPAALALEPHRAKKLYAACRRAADAQAHVDLTPVSPRLGTTLREFATAPLALLGQKPPPAERHYRLLANDLPGASTHKELMQGIALAAGGVARRELPAEDELSADDLKAARQRANLWAIAEAPPGELTNPEKLLGQIGPMVAAMPQETGARVAHGLAQQYARRGQWAMARETFLLLVERYPTHPLAVDGYRWLLLHQASSEARRRHEMGQFLVIGETLMGVPGEMRKPPEPARPAFGQPAKATRRVGEVPTIKTESERLLVPTTTADDVRRWYHACLNLEKRLAGFGPLYAGDPAVQFSVQSARRQLGEHEAATKWYREFAAAQPAGPWRDAALAELWLTERRGPSPKPVLTVRPTDTRPYLDGKLDDPCWQAARPVKLQNAAGSSGSAYPTEVRVTHDRDFLYVAVRCGRPEGPVAPAVPRTRDQDLRRSDRVSVVLDLDRDYGTAFHLQIDERGCIAEDCWGDRSWDPKWFVAVHREPAAWTVEAAIPRTALTGDHLTPGKAWAANVVRVLPGQGVQAFSLPAEAPEEALRPEGMGLLLFAQEVERAERPAADGTPVSR